MSKLHFYKRIGGVYSKIADGDGIISDTYDVTINNGVRALAAGQTYQVRQGQSITGTLSRCDRVDGNTVRFSRVPTLEDFRYRDFYAALAAASKNVSISIAQTDLEFLKSNGYSMCFAKKVGSGDDAGSYNVVWQSLTNYLPLTTFSWTPQFALFGTNSFQDDVQVTAETNIVPIGLGEQSVLDLAGYLGGASTGGSATAITLVNQFGDIHPGLQQLSTLNGVSQSTPLYVAQEAMALGSAALTPIEMVQVWFEQNIATSTMFSDARSLAVEIDLTAANTAARTYENGEWSTPSGI